MPARLRHRDPAVGMTSPVLLGVMLGGGLGVANAAASLLLYRVARDRPTPAFEKVVLGGMLGRLAVVLILVVLVVRLVPIDVLAFSTSLLGAFVVGLVIEIAYFTQRPATDRR